jgi:hypothetical protein
MIKINFSYTDEFNQESTLTKTYTDAIFIDQTAFSLLVDEFKNFMIATGFSQEDVDRIIVQED